MMMPVGLDQLVAQERNERQLRRRRVAARIGDQPGGADRVAIVLGQAIDRLLLQLQRLMRMAVVLRIELRVAQPEVGREVDHLRAARQRLDDHLGGRVRQAAEHDVQAGDVDVLDLHQRRQVVDGELREHFPDRLAGLALGGELPDLGTWMVAQQAEQLRPGVPAGTQYPDPDPLAGHRLSPVLAATLSLRQARAARHLA